jgi:hypothetical protein
MTRLVTVAIFAMGMVCSVAVASPAQGQAASPEPGTPGGRSGQLQGTVRDDLNQPVSEAVVSVVGTDSASAVTDRLGRFVFRSLPPGPYLVRAHLKGYAPVRPSLVQVNGSSRVDHPVRMQRTGSPQLLAAGVGELAAQDDAPVSSADTDVEDDRGDLRWRLRHLRRGVLDEAEVGSRAGGDSDSFVDDTLGAVVRAVASSARMATVAIAELPVTGQLNFLTSTSFERPEDVLSRFRSPSNGVAYLSLDAPSPVGKWTLRGALTRGDLSSWALAGGFVRDGPVAHAYRTGLSYTTQRYEGGNAVALAAVADGDRNVGTVYAYDSWKVFPALTLDYGAQYARYDYLDSPGLLSPEVALTVDAAGFQIRGAVSSRQTAPGATEFESPSADGGLWLPPERTFSSLSRDGFTPQRTTNVEVSAGRVVPGGVRLAVRGFRQRVDDQVATLFGLSVPNQAATTVGHYHVVSAGDIEAHGWGVAASRSFLGRLHGSIEYSESQATWSRAADAAAWLSSLAPEAMRAERERLRDVIAKVDAVIPRTATQMYVVYRINVSSPVEGRGPASPVAARFDVQVRQALPFLNFTNAEWTMLIGVRNVFQEGFSGGSVYDELLVIRPPKRIVGGLTIRF